MKKITLTHPLIGDKDFEPDHAERLLNMQEQTGKPNGGWKLKETETQSDDADSAGNTKKAKRRRAKPRPTE